MKLTISKQLNKTLQDKGWSIRQLAKKSGVSSTTIYNICKGKTMPKTRTLIALADALDITVGYLIGMESKKKKYILYLQKDFMRICREFDEI